MRTGGLFNRSLAASPRAGLILRGSQIVSHRIGNPLNSVDRRFLVPHTREKTRKDRGFKNERRRKIAGRRPSSSYSVGGKLCAAEGEKGSYSLNLGWSEMWAY